MSKVENKFFTRFSPPSSPSVIAKGGRTQQHFKEECDLNVILRRFRLGVPPPVQPAQYVDLTAIPRDLTEAFEFGEKVQDWFFSLPSNVRETFQNDPRVALRLVNDNPKAAIEAGLLPRSDASGAKPAPEAKPIIAKAAEAATPEPPKEAAVDPPSA